MQVNWIAMAAWYFKRASQSTFWPWATANVSVLDTLLSCNRVKIALGEVGVEVPSRWIQTALSGGRNWILLLQTWVGLGGIGTKPLAMPRWRKGIKRMMREVVQRMVVKQHSWLNKVGTDRPLQGYLNSSTPGRLPCSELCRQLSQWSNVCLLITF